MPFQNRRPIQPSAGRDLSARRPHREAAPAGPNRTEELHRALFSDYRPAPRP